MSYKVTDPHTGATLYFEGEQILKAVVEDAVSHVHGFKEAKEVLVAGCSAGGIAVLNQMDGIKGLLQARFGGPRIPPLGPFLCTLVKIKYQKLEMEPQK